MLKCFTKSFVIISYIALPGEETINRSMYKGRFEFDNTFKTPYFVLFCLFFFNVSSKPVSGNVVTARGQAVRALDLQFGRGPEFKSLSDR